MKTFKPDPRLIEVRKRFDWRLSDTQERDLRRELQLTDEEAEELFIQVEYQMSSLNEVEKIPIDYKKTLANIKKQSQKLRGLMTQLYEDDLRFLNTRLLNLVDGLPVLTVEESLKGIKDAKSIEAQKKMLKGEELREFEIDEYLMGKAYKPQSISILSVLDAIQTEMDSNADYYIKYGKWSLVTEALAKAYGRICLHGTDGMPLTKRCISGDEDSWFILMCRIILNEKDEEGGVSIGALSKATKRAEWYQRNHSNWVEQDRKAKEIRQKSRK